MLFSGGILVNSNSIIRTLTTYKRERPQKARPHQGQHAHELSRVFPHCEQNPTDGASWLVACWARKVSANGLKVLVTSVCCRFQVGVS